jgi:lysophospholipase L1-like esterase
MDFAPDILVVMLGTNDAKDWAPAEPEFISTYIDLLDSYLRAYPDLKILLVTAPPTMENNRFNLPNDIITNEVVPLQRDLAALLELPLLDLSAIMHEADGGYGAFLRGDAAFDGVHLSVAGAQLVAQLVAESIASF